MQDVYTPKNIVIIGNGPAACATALSLRQCLAQSANDLLTQTTLTMVSATITNTLAVGETIPPTAYTLLQKLNLTSLLNEQDHLRCPGSYSQWGSHQAGHNDFFFMPEGPGYHLDRTVFNNALQEQVRKEKICIIDDASLKHVTTTHQGYELTLQTKKQTKTITADFVVDASGISAAFARRIGVEQNTYDSVISHCAFFTLPFTQQLTKQAYTLVATAPYGWWYASQLPNQKVLVSLCSDITTTKQYQLNNTENWFTLFNETDWFSKQCEEQFGTKLPSPEHLITRVAPSSILSTVTSPNWLAVGDAASSYDSMTSAGITKALSNGLSAGEALSEYIQSGNEASLKQYQENIFKDFNQYLQLHQQHYQAEQRFVDSTFWAARQLG